MPRQPEPCSASGDPRPPIPWILTTDAEGRVTGANDGFRALVGHSDRALASRPHSALLHPLQPVQPAMDLWAALGGGQAWSGCLAYRQADGQACRLQVHAMPLRCHGQVAGHLLLHAWPPQAPDTPDAPVRRPGPGLVWRLRLGVAALALLAMLSGGLGGLADEHLLAHAVLCMLGATALLRWLQVQVMRPWQQAQRQAQALAAGEPVPAGPDHEVEPLGRALQCAALHQQALTAELAPQLDALCQASHALALQADDLGQRTELAAAALQETATTLEQLRSAAGRPPTEPAPALAAQALGLTTVCEAMSRLDDTTQLNAARTDACKIAAVALAQRAARLSASWRLFRPGPPP